MQISHISIKNIIIDNPIFAAPLAGFSTRSFRDILRQHGAGLAYGEMVSAQAICYGNKRTLELLDLADEPYPRIVQLFGSQPGFMERAAHTVAELGADIIDINMGCPMPKIVNNGEGAALLRQPQLAAELVRAVAKAGLPVTVKLRLGWESGQNVAVELARHLEEAGVALLAVHGRYRDQYYQGRADWGQIAAVKQVVSIPVAGNGDIWSAADALAMLEQTGCDAVMIGRGMLGNPWLMGEIAAAWQGQDIPTRPNRPQVLAIALKHLQNHAVRYAYWLQKREKLTTEQAALAGELAAVRSMRGHLGYYVKGQYGAAALRDRINQLTRVFEIEQLFAASLAEGQESYK